MQLAHHRPQRNGAVSSKHNVLAVLEDTGRISLLPLQAGSNGGVCGKDNGVTFLKEQLGPSGGSLRFTPDGGRLIATDAKGKLVVVDFEDQDTGI